LATSPFTSVHISLIGLYWQKHGGNLIKIVTWFSSDTFTQLSYGAAQGVTQIWFL
jgi:hypothetical protein